MNRLSFAVLQQLLRQHFSTTRNASSAPRNRARLSADRLEDRNATGNLAGGLFAAALGGPLIDPIDHMAAVVGDLALLACDTTLRASPKA